VLLIGTLVRIRT